MSYTDQPEILMEATALRQMQGAMSKFG